MQTHQPASNLLSPADALYQRARDCLARNDRFGAESAAREACALEPLHSGANLLLGDLASQRDQHRDATAHALRAAEKMGKQSLQHIAAVTLRLISVGEYERAAAVICK